MGKSNGKCHFCKIETEYLTHLFYNCTVVKNVLNDIETRINNSLQRKGYTQLSIDLQMVIIGADEKEKNVRVFLNTVLEIFRWELWKIRNLIKYENLSYTSNSITKIVLNKVKACYKFWTKTKVVHKHENALDLLQDLLSE